MKNTSVLKVLVIVLVVGLFISLGMYVISANEINELKGNVDELKATNGTLLGQIDKEKVLMDFKDKEIIKLYKNGLSMKEIRENIEGITNEDINCALSYEHCGESGTYSIFSKAFKYDLEKAYVVFDNNIIEEWVVKQSYKPNVYLEKRFDRYNEIYSNLKDLNFYPYILEDYQTLKNKKLNTEEIILELYKKYGFKPTVLKMLVE